MQQNRYMVKNTRISPICCAHMTFGHELDLLSVRAAAVFVAGIAIRSPLDSAVYLSARSGYPAWLKLEALQPVAAFKIRICNLKGTGAQDTAIAAHALKAAGISNFIKA
jgi:threonine dehydratase